MSRPQARLSDISEVVTGSTPSTFNIDYYGGDIPFITPTQLDKETYVGASETYVTQAGAKAARLIPENSVMVCCIGSLGKVGISSRPLITNQQINSLVINESIADPLYVYFYCKTLSNVLVNMAPKTTVAIVNKSRFSELTIPLPTLATQKHIARVLEQADQLRKQAQQMESELNQLAQSLFLEMFGDGSSKASSNRVPLISLAANEDDIKCGPFGTQLGKSEFTTSGVPLWGIKHVNTNFNLQTGEFVSEAKAKDLNAYSLMSDDIVMTRKGTVGNCHLYPENFVTGIMHSDLLRIRVDKTKVAPLFLVTLLRLSKDVERQIDLISHGAIMAGINVTKLKKIEIDLPPLPMQERFCVKLEAIQEELKRVKQVAEKHETLFMALMQRAFNGELNAPERKAA